MAITNGYCSLAELKARLGIADATDDAVLEDIVTAVSRGIDDETGEWFYPITETRYYAPTCAHELAIDSCLSLTSVKTDEDGDGVFERTLTAATDYYLAPVNAPKGSRPRPYTALRRAPNATYSFPVAPNGVELVGSFGWSPTTPPVVKAACLYQAALEYESKDAPTGSAGGAEFENQVRSTGLHPFVRRMLYPYKRLMVA